MKPSILPIIIFFAMSAALLAMLLGFWQMGAMVAAAAIVVLASMNGEM